MTLENIAHEIRNCTRCTLGVDRMQEGYKKAVPGQGSSNASILFIGEKPGKYESDTGFPYAGKSGQQLRRFLQEAGISSTDIFTTFVVCCAPSETRNPSTEEFEACIEYTYRQIAIIDPDILVTVGSYASKQFIEPLNTRKQNMGDLHGIPSWVTIDGVDRIVVPMYHSAAAIHNEDLAPLIKEDFDKLGKRLRQIHASREGTARVLTTSPKQPPVATLRKTSRPNTPRPYRIIEHTNI